MTIKVFNKIEVDVDDSDIKAFSSITSTFKSYTAEYFILSEGLDENASKENMEKAIKNGIRYELFARTHSLDETSKAVREGIIY